MVKHTQTIRWHLPMNCLIVFDHFIGLLWYHFVLGIVRFRYRHDLLKTCQTGIISESYRKIIFVSATKIEENTINIFKTKFTSQSIKLNTQLQGIKFTSHKQYLFGRLFPIKAKKTQQTKVHFKIFYSVRIETIHKPSKVAAANFFSLVSMLQMQLALMNLFILCDNWKTLLF